jgi:hypothetical protein
MTYPSISLIRFQGMGLDIFPLQERESKKNKKNLGDGFFKQKDQDRLIDCQFWKIALGIGQIGVSPEGLLLMLTV